MSDCPTEYFERFSFPPSGLLDIDMLTTFVTQTKESSEFTQEEKSIMMRNVVTRIGLGIARDIFETYCSFMNLPYETSLTVYSDLDTIIEQGNANYELIVNEVTKYFSHCPDCYNFYYEFEPMIKPDFGEHYELWISTRHLVIFGASIDHIDVFGRSLRDIMADSLVKLSFFDSIDDMIDCFDRLVGETTETCESLPSMINDDGDDIGSHASASCAAKA